MQFVCKGGWRVKDVHSAIPEIIKQKPHIVILQCGSNDLSSETAYVVAVNLIDAAKKIRTLTEAEVMVCQILQRHQGRYISTVEGVNKFNEKVNVVNEFLKVNCGPISLKYWKHRGMSNPNVANFGDILCQDGVHLSHRGQYKYYKSLRGAVLFGSKEL